MILPLSDSYLDLYLGEEKEELLYAQIDKEQIQNIRTANPVFENRRKDLYD